MTSKFEGLPTGTDGTIALKYDYQHFEVEFFDESRETIEVLTSPVDAIETVSEG